MEQFYKEISIPIEKPNQFFETVIFPDALKVARIIPMFKKGDLQQCSNYRPISLTSIISKIMEKLVQQHLYIFLEDNLLNDKQLIF